MLKSYKVIERKNAVMGLSDECDPKIPMDADHSGICRFRDPKGDDFV